MAIKSKFRAEFWMLRFGFFLVLAFIIVLLFRAGMAEEITDDINYYTLFACLISLLLLYQVFIFLFSELFVMLISEEHIIIRYFILRKPWVIRYTEILSISGVAVESQNDGLSWDNRIFVVSLTNDREFVFADNRYKNYDECKFWIQEYFLRHEAGQSGF